MMELHLRKGCPFFKLVNNQNSFVIGPWPTLKNLSLITFFLELKQPEVFIDLLEEDVPPCPPYACKERFESLLVDPLRDP